MKIVRLQLMILLTISISYSLDLQPIKIVKNGKAYIAFDLKDGADIKKYVKLGLILEKDAAVYAAKETKWQNKLILFTVLGLLKGFKDGAFIGAGYCYGKQFNLF